MIEPFTVHSVPASGPEARASVLGVTAWYFQRQDTTSDLKLELLALTLAWLLTGGRFTHKYVAVRGQPYLAISCSARDRPGLRAMA